MSTAETLTGMADMAKAAATPLAAINPVAGIVAGIIGAALKAGSAIAAGGGDPVLEITRILAAAPEVKKVHVGWEAAIVAKFGQRATTIPPAAGPFDTEIPAAAISNPYDED